MDITYTVQKGDNLYSIAKNFNTTISNIMTLNNLHNNLLTIGQVLIIKKEQSIVENQIGSDICGIYQEPYDLTTDTYIVQYGDSLYSIAKKFNTTVSNIIYLNDLKNNLLSINQILKVPHK